MRSALPKVLHKVGGRSLIGHVLAAARTSGATAIDVVIGPEREDVGAEVKKLAPSAGVFVQRERLGTAHAVLQAKAALGGDDNLIVAFGDTPLVRAQTFALLADALKDAAVAVLGFRPKDPHGYGRLVEKDGNLVAIREEKDASDAEKKIGLCNAGIMALPTLEQVGGLEKHFVTNHLGHFLLVNRLLDRVVAAPRGRVVVLSSRGYIWAPPEGIEFDNLSGERGEYDANRAYGQSKLANGLFSLELARRLAGTNATSNSVHPGIIKTKLGRHFPEWKKVLSELIGWTFMKSVPEGAATQCYVATNPRLAGVTGRYFANCNPEIPGGRMEDRALAAKLWSVSEGLTRPWLT